MKFPDPMPPMPPTVFHAYAAGKSPVIRPSPVDEEDLQRMADAFLAKYPIPEDPEKSKRHEALMFAIFWKNNVRKGSRK